MPNEEYTVKDRRRFTAEGELKEEVEAGEAAERNEREEKARPADKTDTCAGAHPLPEINFATFIFSLSTSALMNLGELPDPGTGEACQNLPLAKQTIDILGMLQEKTRSNLDQEEEQLLNNLLYDLRLKYVAAVKK